MLNEHPDTVRKQFTSCLFPFFQLKDDQKAQVSEFFKLCYYVKGPYNEASGFINLNTELAKLGEGKDVVHRLFYLALPPSVFMDASENIKQHCMGSKYVIHIGIDYLFNMWNYMLLMPVIQLAVMNNNLTKT